MPGACPLGSVTAGSPPPPRRSEERRAQRLGFPASQSGSCAAGVQAPGGGVSRPELLGSGWAGGWLWESAYFSEDLVPDYPAQAPGFPDVHFVAIPTLDGGAW